MWLSVVWFTDVISRKTKQNAVFVSISLDRLLRGILIQFPKYTTVVIKCKTIDSLRESIERTINVMKFEAPIICS